MINDRLQSMLGVGATTAVAIGAFAAASAGAAAAATPDYAIVASWKLGGAGGWDYLTMDSPHHRLFVTRGDHVEVVDVDSGKIIGRIPGTNGVHGVALAPDLNRGYTSNGRANTVTEFNYDTLAVLREVPVPGLNPDAILYEPASRHLFTFNGRSKDATVYDASTLAVIAKLPLPDKPEFAVSDGKGRVFANIESEAGQIVAIDAAKASVAATWTMPGCASPSGLAIDRAHDRLFSVCDGKVMAITDAKSGGQIARVPIGEHPDAADFDAADGLAFSSNGDGTLTVVQQQSADKYVVAATVTTRRGARTMTFDPASRKIYLVTADFGPPPPATAEQPHPRPPAVPDSFTVLVAAPR